jgi:hypothetical protein
MADDPEGGGTRRRPLLECHFATGRGVMCTGEPNDDKVSVSVLALGPVGKWANPGSLRAAAGRTPLKREELRACTRRPRPSTQITLGASVVTTPVRSRRRRSR